MRKEGRQLLRRIERQGARLEYRRSCVLIYAPDGRTVVTMHHTDSDPRGMANTRARLKAAGFTC